MKVSFRTKYRDLIAFNIHIFYRSPIVIGMAIIILVIGIKPNWQAVINTAGDKPQFFQIVLFIILELVPLAIMFVLSTSQILLFNLSKRLKTVHTVETINLGEDVSITLGEEVIYTKSTNKRIEISWTDLQFLAQTRNYIFMYGTKRKNLVIPKRAFDSVEAIEEFWNACKAKVKKRQRKRSKM